MSDKSNFLLFDTLYVSST